MKREERKSRLALTMLVAFSIFIIQVLSVLMAALVVYLMVHCGMIVDFSQNMVSLQRTLFFMVAISTVLGVIITALSSKVSLEPINRMISQMNRLASGDFKARIHFGKPISGHPTFQQIENSFNAAAEELEHTQILRSDFINNFSHEFKTPIVSIAGFAKLLRRGNLTPEQQQEYLAVIEEESLRLAYMANNVLNLTRVENQTILSDVTSYNLSEQLRSAVLLLEDKWARKNLELNLHMGEHRISAEEELLKHVWINLLDNAVKFSEEYGCIDIWIEEMDDRLRVRISNGGSTIPKESLGRIFNKFYQADESHSSEGNGIGLAIVRRVVQLHRGTVTVQSEKGTTTFTVELPKMR